MPRRWVAANIADPLTATEAADCPAMGKLLFARGNSGTAQTITDGDTRSARPCMSMAVGRHGTDWAQVPAQGLSLPGAR
ncbi:hypothetical protein RSO01_11100 [Reyranella soli]|uniref:Uncharacterized protein n=1 Tax=Reyranella soli TaxID=1230389 RepID=A0A512N4N6_9HYPH|nr:hypothetical protein RSO01_11100 [Reyranella soli]